MAAKAIHLDSVFDEDKKERSGVGTGVHIEMIRDVHWGNVELVVCKLDKRVFYQNDIREISVKE